MHKPRARPNGCELLRSDPRIRDRLRSGTSWLEEGPEPDKNLPGEVAEFDRHCGHDRIAQQRLQLHLQTSGLRFRPRAIPVRASAQDKDARSPRVRRMHPWEASGCAWLASCRRALPSAGHRRREPSSVVLQRDWIALCHAPTAMLPGPSRGFAGDLRFPLRSTTQRVASRPGTSLPPVPAEPVEPRQDNPRQRHRAAQTRCEARREIFGDYIPVYP